MGMFYTTGSFGNKSDQLYICYIDAVAIGMDCNRLFCHVLFLPLYIATDLSHLVLFLILIASV